MDRWNWMVLLLACNVCRNDFNGVCCNSINHWNIWSCRGNIIITLSYSLLILISHFSKIIALNIMCSIFYLSIIFQEKSGLLLLFSILLVCMFFFHLIAAIVITVWGVEESPVLIKELREVFLDLIYGWDVDPRKSRILRQIQEYVSIL